MENSQFETILKELESFFNCPLKADLNNSCLIKMGIGISVQLEMSPQGKLLVGCSVATLPPGKYRDNIIKAALKANEATLPSTGSFGFSTKTNHLILFEVIDLNKLNQDDIETMLTPYIAKAKEWTEALAKGEIPVIAPKVKATSGLFGLL